jgi:hypothetical protein
MAELRTSNPPSVKRAGPITSFLEAVLRFTKEHHDRWADVPPGERPRPLKMVGRMIA